jgi:hypothetical protein
MIVDHRGARGVINEWPDGRVRYPLVVTVVVDLAGVSGEEPIRPIPHRG